VLADGENLREEVRIRQVNAPIRLGLNAVGGGSALRSRNTLAPESTLVTFGAMSLQALKIPMVCSFSKTCAFAEFGSTNGTITRRWRSE